MNPKLTVFTPTYNRGYIIETLYRSLQRQGFTDFEWLVVDDGSSDDTGKLFERWEREGNPFSIRYVYQENGGKCRAINHGLELAKGELFFTVDAGDYLTDDALEKVIAWEKTVAGQPGFCGVAGNLGTSVDETPNTPLNAPYWDGDLMARYPDAHREKRIDGERALVFYTDIHRKYLYPSIPGENFMTEAVTWNRMARDGYRMRFFDDIIWIYEYLEDGLTKAGFRPFENNPRGYTMFMMERTKFLHPGALAMWKCRYGLYCDLAHRYSDPELAGFLGISGLYLQTLRLPHKLLNYLKGRGR